MEPTQRRLFWVDIEIARDASTCWRLLCDVERTPDWVPGVAAVKTLERDGGGRVTLARFIGMPSRGSFAYTLRYTYDDDARRVFWESEDSAIRELFGEGKVDELAPARARLHYGLCASVTEILPGWAQTALRDERPDPVAEAFRRFAESA